jgi:hypothetical protein
MPWWWWAFGLVAFGFGCASYQHYPTGHPRRTVSGGIVLCYGVGLVVALVHTLMEAS